MSVPKRIVIFGLPGSGKSTFSIRLSEALHIPVHHIDKHFFTHNWKVRETTEFLEIQSKLIQNDSWIIEGNAIKSLEMRFNRGDDVLYFRFNRLLCLSRIFRRLFLKDPRIKDRPEGCSERVTLGLIRYLWTFHKERHKFIYGLKAKYPHIKFYEFKKQHDIENYFSTLLKEKNRIAKGFNPLP